MCMDGIVVCMDGIVVCMDGIVVCMDGIVVCMDGIVVCMDGIVVCMDGIVVCMDGIVVCMDGIVVTYLQHITEGRNVVILCLEYFLDSVGTLERPCLQYLLPHCMPRNRPHIHILHKQTQ